MNGHFLLAFTLTLLAGLSTVIGALLIFWFKNISNRFLSFGLGLSAGVMIYLSFFELLKESNRLIRLDFGVNYSWLVIVFFLVGLTLAGIIDSFTHSRMETYEEHSENKCQPGQPCAHPPTAEEKHHALLLKTGLFTAIIITIHNFPEGVLTFISTGINPIFGVSIAIAVAIHNIPEGFCIALPIYYATKNKTKSILYALLAGLAEPIGALLTYFILYPYMNNFVLAVMLAIVAGIMVYVSFDELLPTARRFKEGHTSLFGLIVGMILMAFSLYLLY